MNDIKFTKPRLIGMDLIRRAGMGMVEPLSVALGGKDKAKNFIRGCRSKNVLENFAFPGAKRLIYYRFTKEAAEEFELSPDYVGPLRLTQLRIAAATIEFCWLKNAPNRLLLKSQLEEFDERLSGIYLSTRCAVLSTDKNGHDLNPRLAPLRLDYSGKDPFVVIGKLLSLLARWAENHEVFLHLIRERKLHPVIVSASEERAREIESAIHRKNSGKKKLPFPVSATSSQLLKQLF